MPFLVQKARKNAAGVGMIVHQQQSQFFRSPRYARCPVRRGRDWLRQEMEKNSKRRSPVFAGALYLDRSSMQIDQGFGNRQTEAQSAETPGNGTLTLMKRFKN